MAFITERRKRPTIAELPGEVYAREVPTTATDAVAPLPMDLMIYADAKGKKVVERLPYYSRPSRRAKSIVRHGFRYRLIWI